MTNNAPLELGTESIGKLLKQYALPSIVAMTAASLYNIVDSIFIGHGVGPLALSGLAVSFPFSNLSAAFGAMVGVGGSAMVSMLLGQKNYKIAKKVLSNVLWLNIFIGFLFMTISLLFLDDILYFFGASSDSLPYARDYMKIILYGNIITHLYFGQNAVLRAAGHPTKALLTTLITVIINSILDPIFIFNLNMGVKGAAIATVISQFVSLLWQFKIFNSKKEILHYDIEEIHLDRNLINKIIGIGLSPFFMNAAGCLVTLLINQQLQKYSGDLAVGAYGIANRFAFLFFMIALGLNQGMQPIAGYNFGAGKMDRVMHVFKLTVKISTIIFMSCFIIGEIAPSWVASAFTSDNELISLAIPAIRIIVLFFPLLSFQVVCSQLFQSLGLVGKAVFLSLSRQLIFLIPALLLFPLILGLKGIWWSMPFSDFITSFTAYILFVRFKKQTSNGKITVKL